LNRVFGKGPKKSAPLIESVDLGFGVMVGLEIPGEKEEKLSTRGPAAATLLLGGMPIPEQLVKG